MKKWHYFEDEIVYCNGDPNKELGSLDGDGGVIITWNLKNGKMIFHIDYCRNCLSCPEYTQYASSLTQAKKLARDLMSIR